LIGSYTHTHTLPLFLSPSLSLPSSLSLSRQTPYEIINGLNIHRVLIVHILTRAHTHTCTYTHTFCAHPHVSHIYMRLSVPLSLFRGRCRTKSSTECTYTACPSRTPARTHIHTRTHTHTHTHTHTRTHTWQYTVCPSTIHRVLIRNDLIFTYIFGRCRTKLLKACTYTA